MNVLGVREEEYCYIPMGGELPDLRQRGNPAWRAVCSEKCAFAAQVHFLALGSSCANMLWNPGASPHTFPLRSPSAVVVSFGGAAGMVHPATGYHACRMMAAAPGLARAIGELVRPICRQYLVPLSRHASLFRCGSHMNLFSGREIHHGKRMSAIWFQLTEHLVASAGEGIRSGAAPDVISCVAYESVWSAENRSQRDFQVILLDY
jgi:hypothetical protein